MNKYRMLLIILAVLFAIIAIVSSAIGVGLLQSIFVIVAFILLLGIFVGGIAVLGAKEFWWGYFKPLAAVPIAWGLLHLGFTLMLPDISAEIWSRHWKFLMAFELFIITLCVIVNKKRPFERRISRWLMEMTLILFFIFAGAMIGCRLFAGEFTANLNRAMLFSLMNSRVELAVGNIEKSSKKHEVKFLLTELNRLSEESKNRSLSKPELERVEKLKAAVKKKYAVPDEKKIDWEKLFSFIKLNPSRHLSGIFRLPADGRAVGRDVDGYELWYEKNEIIQLKQLSSPGKYTFINQGGKIDSWTREYELFHTTPAIGRSKVELKSESEKELVIRVKIIKPRS